MKNRITFNQVCKNQVTLCLQNTVTIAFMTFVLPKVCIANRRVCAKIECNLLTTINFSGTGIFAQDTRSFKSQLNNFTQLVTLRTLSSPRQFGRKITSGFYVSQADI